MEKEDKESLPKENTQTPDDTNYRFMANSLQAINTIRL